MATFAPTRTTMHPPVWQTASATHVDMVSETMCPRRVSSSPSPGSSTRSDIDDVRARDGTPAPCARQRMPSSTWLAFCAFVFHIAGDIIIVAQLWSCDTWEAVATLTYVKYFACTPPRCTSQSVRRPCCVSSARSHSAGIYEAVVGW